MVKARIGTIAPGAAGEKTLEDGNGMKQTDFNAKVAKETARSDAKEDGMKVELTGLEIKVEGGVLKLTIDEAKDLYIQLHALFGEKIISSPQAPIIVPYTPPEPIQPWVSPPNPLRPMWPYRPLSPWTIPMYDRPEITCFGNAVGES